MFNIDISRIVLTLPGILLALTFHEFAHAYSAYLLGDPTAKHYGRLTLNPFSHIDVIGFLMLLFAGFGWAKPVPVNPSYFSKRKLGYFLVSMAGPFTNILLAILFTAILGLQIVIIESVLLNRIVVYAIFINLMLAVFNLFPIPPLDGSKLLLMLLPEAYEYKYYAFEKYAYIILILLIVFDIIDMVLFPIVNFLFNTLMRLLMIFI